MNKEIKIPTNCPSCSSILEIINSQLFCRNRACPAQYSKKVEAFVKKMRIKGFGPATIKKLGFTHPIDLYEASLDDYVEVMGEKMGDKLFNEVQNSRLTTFATFLSALSIPLIGDTASKKIATMANSIDALYNHTQLGYAGIGPKALHNLFTWMNDNLDDVEQLESYFTFSQPVKRVEQNLGKVCITGKLKDFSNRTKAKEYLESLGYTVTSTVSSMTDYLVCEDGSNSSKTKKAESLGIPIVSIANLKGN
jgi:DNA ligase (NAD+)